MLRFCCVQTALDFDLFFCKDHLHYEYTALIFGTQLQEQCLHPVKMSDNLTCKWWPLSGADYHAKSLIRGWMFASSACPIQHICCISVPLKKREREIVRKAAFDVSQHFAWFGGYPKNHELSLHHSLGYNPVL